MSKKKWVVLFLFLELLKLGVVIAISYGVSRLFELDWKEALLLTGGVCMLVGYLLERTLALIKTVEEV